MTRWAPLAILLLAQAAPLVSEHVEYYEIRGSSEQELRSEMKRRGPQADDGTRHAGYTHWYVRWRFELLAGEECAVASVSTSVEVTITLPKWTNASRAPDSLVLRWRSFQKALERHERGHAEFGVEAAQAVRARLLEEPPSPDCTMLETALNEAAERVLEDVRQRESLGPSDASWSHRGSRLPLTGVLADRRTPTWKPGQSAGRHLRFGLE